VGHIQAVDTVPVDLEMNWDVNMPIVVVDLKIS
jgi:hypothetical protein